MIDLAELIQHLQRLRVSARTLARLFNLCGGLKQQRLHAPWTKAAVKIKERAVAGTAAVAVAVGLAALEEPLDERGMQEMGRQFKGSQQMGLALAQRQSGGAFERGYPTHVYT